MQRFGFHEQPTTLVLTFDRPLDPARAQNVSSYRIIALRGLRRSIAIKSAVYDAATRTVTVSPARRLNVHFRFRLTVLGTGLTGLADASGVLLDGRSSGDPGSNFVADVTIQDLVRTTSDLRKHSAHTASERHVPLDRS
jgi:hypothetical protein